MKKLTKEQFIEKSRKVHGGFYDYSNVNYVNSSIKVKIICPQHGEFTQTPHNHLYGYKCIKCGLQASSQKARKSLDDFISQANAIHNNKYDYSKSIYINNRTKVKIICPTHGEFMKTPTKHLLGQGCPKCSSKLISENQTKDIELFITEANKIHNNKYDYPDRNYVNARTKILINCPIHGLFSQTPDSHLHNHGCPKCSGIESPQELMIRSKLSELNITYKNNVIIDKRYPWRVDIYIPERDLFLEYNGFWTHGNEWYDGRRKTCKENISLWKSKTGPQYINALDTFTERDVLKRKTAKKNNLNYVVLWNEKDIEDWFTLGCPDGHDGDGMYTWRKDNE